MSNQQKLDSATQNKPKNTSAKPAKKTRGVLAKAITLVLVAGVGVGGYFGYIEAQRLQAMFKDNVTQLDQQQQALVSLNNQLQQDQKKIDRLEYQLREQNKSIEAFASLQYQLNELTAALSGASESERTLWTIHELEFLVRMAQERMIVSKDIESARALLNAADKQLKKISDPQVSDIRAALARDILALSIYEPVDSVGLYARVSALQNSLSALTINSGDSTPLRASSEEAPWWKRVFDVFGVSYSTSQSLKIVPPSEAQLFQRQLSLTLEQSLLAISSGDHSLWVNSLQRAYALVDTYYVSNHSKEAHLNEVKSLMALSVTNERIRINATSAALEAYKQSRMEAAE